MQHSHYTVRIPRPDEPLRILEPVELPELRSDWVEVVVEDGRVHSMEAVPFDIATLDRVHFVAGGLAEFYEEKTGEPLYVGDDIRLDWAERLRPHLAPSGTP